ncbi:MAG TPA: GNAT family protein [Nitriliruptorales bacterium]|nr:GNAT family protein [Nitriliruptorales bacterium]
MPRSGRVFLRPPEAADREQFVRLARASVAFHEPWVDAPSTPREFDEYLERGAAEDTDCSLLCLREEREIGGVFNLTQIVYGVFRSAYLGYYAFADHAGQGYMTEGLELVLDRAFGTLRLHRLEANIQPGNDRSKALVERCGFRYEGFSPRYLYIGGAWRDHERWAITVEDRDG